MHIIIIGAGEVGSSLAQRLSQESKDVVIIDPVAERLRHVQELSDVQTIQGSGSSPSTLAKAGLDEADLLIAVTDSDEVNLVACLITHATYPSTTKVARVRNPEYYEKSDILGKDNLGIDLAINPEREAAQAITNLLEIPMGATDIANFAEGRVKLIGLNIEVGSPLAGRKLSMLPELNPDRNFLIVAIVRDDDNVIIPSGDDHLRVGDIVYSVTVPEGVNELFRVAGKEVDKVKRIMIVGGTNIGEYLARRFARKGFNTKLIDRDERRCEELAERYRGLTVIHGDGTNRDLLVQEGIEECDAFIGSTHDEEDNILMSLLASRTGARRVIPVVNRMTYAPLVSALGVDSVVSPRAVAVSSILGYIRAGKILSVRTLRNDVAEALEFIALETSDLVDRPLAQVKLPRGAIIGAVVRDDEIIIPTGADVLRAGDRVIAFASRKAIPKMEKALSVKVDFF